ncbi:NACHT, LRR and PYD domains-containing protein 12-like [Megalobrama amblycephala]|uniref:NACHT, LRR and PYD domains-containing protein 12-like n=1 Tax=Megalobrama amblycephala TaxID=75352 RepID=UPI002013F72C|nr:NACHT, LRR and PYD domains-containing protein 12-like [Megalobrama amblycephala]
MRSDASKDLFVEFGNNPPGNISGIHKERLDESESLDVSHVRMKRDASKDCIPHCNIKDNSSGPINKSQLSSVCYTIKQELKNKFQSFYEGAAMHENPTLLNKIYTELYITEVLGGEVNNQHEIRQIETVFRRAITEDRPINCNNIFKPLLGQDLPIRTVLTKGIAGVGKTVSVQKFILDWAEGKANQDVHLIFPLPFRELNLLKYKIFSLKDLLQFSMGTKQLEISPNEGKVIFIFDGLDECRLSLDFQNNARLCKVTKSASVDVLLTNLIVGNLLPSALIWITSRPAAADLIPSECVDRVTEVRGFSDPQKEEYFRKRIRDQTLANKINSHLKSLRSLYIMCHIPVFCWISATVLEKMLFGSESGEIPKTLTQMYTHFLTLQINFIREKDYENKVKDDDMVLRLGKLAFQQLVKGNPIFYQEDLWKCGIIEREASVYSGLCNQIFKEEFGMQGKIYCFIHLSVQEHLAALYVHITFMSSKENAFDFINSDLSLISKLLTTAVNEALKSKSGHLDLFLRFLLGLSLESNQILLQSILTKTKCHSHCTEETIKFIKKKIQECTSSEKSINLFHCLNELGDRSLEEEIQHYMSSGSQRGTKLSPSQWSALAFVLLSSGQGWLDEFELNKYTGPQNTANEVLLNLQHVVKASRSARLNGCGVTHEGCAVLASVLRSENLYLRELDLSNNNLRDLGVKQLMDGFKSPHCKLKILRLSRCEITDEGCAALASALRSNPSHLKELDLSKNNFGDSGVKMLCAELNNPLCKLTILGLRDCDVTDEGCAVLASALRSNPLHLRELDLSENKLIGDSGVKWISTVLENPLCKLKSLRLMHCHVTNEGCADLASALTSNPSHLKYLVLSGNRIRDLGVYLLSGAMKNPDCKIEMLWLDDCGITDEGCAALASALRSNPSHLTFLNLSRNPLSDSGIKPLYGVVQNPVVYWIHFGCMVVASQTKVKPL